MKGENVLSIDQMRHLKELGVDTSDASMWWIQDFVYNERNLGATVSISNSFTLSMYEMIDAPLTEEEASGIEIVPAYTLQDILKKLPMCIPSEDGKHVYTWYLNAIGDIIYADTNEGTSFKMLQSFLSNHNPLKSAYNMLCWCIEKGYYKEKKEQ